MLISELCLRPTTFHVHTTHNAPYCGGFWDICSICICSTCICACIDAIDGADDDDDDADSAGGGGGGAAGGGGAMCGGGAM